MENVTMDVTTEEAARMRPGELRDAIAAGRWTAPTVGLALGHLQANMVVVPRELAFDFMLFCHRNPKPCPLIDVTEPGSALVDAGGGATADLRTTIPRYRVWEHGRLVDEPLDATAAWREDAVAFLFGCSLTFEEALQAADVPLRHLEAGRQPPVYVTDVQCTPAGRFAGPLVVTMRPLPGALVARAVEVTARYPLGHGAPVHVGDPAALGIADLDAIDFGDLPAMEPGDVPVFWACGVTPQMAVQGAGAPWTITHYPAHMFVFDRLAEAGATA